MSDFQTENIGLMHYPFGMLMPGRNFSSETYRFGFQNQEKDDEIAGEGNSNTAEYWQYDTRLGRRWNVDPKPNPAISNYATMINNPIFFIDLKGDTTRVYSKFGKLLKTIPDNLPNEEHFLSSRSFTKLTKLMGSKNVNEVGKKIRSLSEFYVGETTRMEMKNISSVAEKEGLERGYLFSYTKENKQLKVDDISEFFDSRTKNKLSIYKYKMTNAIESIPGKVVAFGHTHGVYSLAESNKQQGNKPSILNKPTESYIINELADYGPKISRRGHDLMFIATNYGYTIYSSYRENQPTAEWPYSTSGNWQESVIKYNGNRISFK